MFYNNLFTVEITVFGIIAAAIFVFLQIVYSQFSYREVFIIFKNKYLASYFVLSTFTLITTGFSSLLLSFPSHNFIPAVNFNINGLMFNEYFALGTLLSFFISLALFVLLTFANLKYIRPPMIALLIGEGIKVNQIRNFLLKKYGVSAPDSWAFASKLYDGIDTDNFLLDLPMRGKDKKKELTKKEAEAGLVTKDTYGWAA